MLKKRVIPCLDVRDGAVVKGVRFANHRVVGDVLTLAETYGKSGADELVFYDIKASTVGGVVDRRWIERIAATLNIPFCVAGGIRTVSDALSVLRSGADKVSINSPALQTPELIDQIAQVVGSQSLVIGIDSHWVDGDWWVFQYTGSAATTKMTGRKTVDWVREVESRGAGEIVLNCMSHDGVRQGYDIEQLKTMRELLQIPLIASGGAGAWEHIRDVFYHADVDGALAASIFHDGVITIPDLKMKLKESGIAVREG